jgi:hypothetical protein
MLIIGILSWLDKHPVLSHLQLISICCRRVRVIIIDNLKSSETLSATDIYRYWNERKLCFLGENIFSSGRWKWSPGQFTFFILLFLIILVLSIFALSVTFLSRKWNQFLNIASKEERWIRFCNEVCNEAVRCSTGLRTRRQQNICVMGCWIWLPSKY